MTTEPRGLAQGKARTLALAALLVATAAAYAPAVGEFHWDDGKAVLRNPVVLDPSRIGWRDFVPPSLGRNRPLTDLTFAANYRVSGTANAPYVATNVAIHLAAVLLAWAVARALLRRSGHPRAEGLALAVGSLFALHPLQTEAVSFVSQRAESLASALYLGAVLLALRAEDAQRRGAPWAGAAAAAAVVAVAALAAKPIAITLPAVLLVFAWTRTKPSVAARGARWAALLGAAAAGAVLLGVLVIRSLEGERTGAGLGAGELGPWRYVLTEAGVILRYLGLLAWPPAQSLDHAVRESPGLADPITLACSAAVLGLVGLGLWLGGRARRSGDPAAAVGSVGVLWYFLLLAPTSSLVPLLDPMAEHRTYLANLGAFLAVAVALEAALQRRWPPATARRLGAAALVAVLAAAGIALVARNRIWGDDLALWSDALRKAPDGYRANLMTGNALTAAGRSAVECLPYYARAALRVPEGRYDWARYQNSYAIALSDAGRPADARTVLERAIARAPQDPELRATLAWMLHDAGDRGGALAVVRAARALGLDGAELTAVAGKVAAEQGDLATAVQELRRAAALAPEVSIRHSDLAIVSWNAGLAHEACAEIARFVATERDPAARAEGLRVQREWGCGAR